VTPAYSLCEWGKRALTSLHKNDVAPNAFEIGREVSRAAEAFSVGEDPELARWRQLRKTR